MDYEELRGKNRSPLIPPGGRSRAGRENGKFPRNSFHEKVISPQAAEAQRGDAPCPEVPAPDTRIHSPACSSRRACPGTSWQVGWAWEPGFCKVPLLPWAVSSKNPEWEEQALWTAISKSARLGEPASSLWNGFGWLLQQRPFRLSGGEKHLC